MITRRRAFPAGAAAGLAAGLLLLATPGCENVDGILGKPPPFSDIEAGIPGFGNAAVAWGDYDSDGDLDLVLAGHWTEVDWETGVVVAEHYESKIYRNDGHCVFTDVGAQLAGVRYGSLARGDYDGDGDLDLALAGRVSDSPEDICRIYENDGGQFADAGCGLPGICSCSLAWGDFDNDGDLDLAYVGMAIADPLTGESHGKCGIHRNNCPVRNRPPSASPTPSRAPLRRTTSPSAGTPPPTTTRPPRASRTASASGRTAGARSTRSCAGCRTPSRAAG